MARALKADKLVKLGCKVLAAFGATCILYGSDLPLDLSAVGGILVLIVLL